MAVEEINSPPPTVSMEKPFRVTNIKSHVPLVLDLDQLNYDSWCELFTSHCESFGVYGLLDGTYTSTSETANEWKKFDSLVKVWIYGTISTSLLQTVLKRNVTTKDVWKSLVGLFHDNKEARSMELHEELRSLEIGSLTISEYFKKIKVISYLLSNIDSSVSEKNLLMYAANGLIDKYEHVASIISHTKTPLILLEARFMLLLEESGLTRKQGRDNAGDTPSSLLVLLASGSSANKDRPNKELCHNFQHGFCRFVDRCKFIHSRGSHNGKSSQWGSQARSTAPHQYVRGPQVASSPNTHATWAGPTSFPQAHLTEPNTSILGPGPYQPMPYGYLDQPTAIPRAFNETTLRYYCEGIKTHMIEIIK
ncbi:hybrid signal transduction histidine kinase M [Tanacetum coccineum]